MAHYHVSAGGAGTYSGADWANAMRWSDYVTSREGASAGDNYWIKDGSYTMTVSVDSSGFAGTAASPITIIGVKSATTNEGANIVFSDWSLDAADRPAIDGVTYQDRFSNYNKIFNLDYSSSNVTVVLTGSYCGVRNCKIENDYGTSSASHFALKITLYSYAIQNEITAPNGSGINGTGYGRYLLNYIYGCSDTTNGYGANISGICNSLIGNIFSDNNTGLLEVSPRASLVLNNVFYDSGNTHQKLATVSSNVIVNNIYRVFTGDAINVNAAINIDFYWNNHTTNGVADFTNIATTGPNSDGELSTGDPQFETPGSDFDLRTGSPCLDTGMWQKYALTTTELNIGVMQNPSSAAGAGLLTHPGMNGRLNG